MIPIKLLHYTSIVGVWMFLYGSIWLILHWTVGFIPIIRNTKIQSVPLEIPLFSAVTIMIILAVFDISSPYEKYLE